MNEFFLTDNADPDLKLSSKQRKRIRLAENAKKETRKLITESDSSENDNNIDGLNLQYPSTDEEHSDNETPAQKRLRLAKGYLQKIKQDVYDINDGEIDAAEIDKQLISERLRNDALELAGKAFRLVADKYQSIDLGNILTLKCGKNGKSTLTCVAFVQLPYNADSTSPNSFIYAGSKDASIFKWDLVTGKRIIVLHGGLKPTKKLIKSIGSRVISNIGHNDHILTMDTSSDGKFLVSISFFTFFIITSFPLLKEFLVNASLL
jgi:ribosomal RNA-processing protein 9